MPRTIGPVNLILHGHEPNTRWVSSPAAGIYSAPLHILHVQTDEGVEGICTVGDARYTTMTTQILEQLRVSAIGHDPLERMHLYNKMHAATRHIFEPPGWFGAFDNCLWDIAGKVAEKPVYSLIGKVRPNAPAYYNIRGETVDELLADTEKAISKGFIAAKDHLRNDTPTNIAWMSAIRNAVGPDVDLMHDAVMSAYSLDDAITVGKQLADLKFRWFEEPLSDRYLRDLQTLCRTIDVPVLNPESLMNDIDLSSEWLITGATDLLRANGRHGTTPVLKLADLAKSRNTTIELNGPGGLFGILHAHMMCCIHNTSYYEYFPNGSRDELGKEIGLLNPAIPINGRIRPPDGPGWGAEWDMGFFKKKRIAVI